MLGAQCAELFARWQSPEVPAVDRTTGDDSGSARWRRKGTATEKDAVLSDGRSYCKFSSHARFVVQLGAAWQLARCNQRQKVLGHQGRECIGSCVTELQRLSEQAEPPGGVS